VCCFFSRASGVGLTVIGEILVLGTGRTLVQPPSFLRAHLNKMGIQLDVMDTVRLFYSGALGLSRLTCS